MDLYATNSFVLQLEARHEALADAEAGPLGVELAWHLRQRDCARALRLLDAAESAWSDSEQAAERWLDLRFRSALTRCEIAALYSQLDAAEAYLLEARACLPSAGDKVLEGDALLAESVVAKACGQRERELEAYGRAKAQYQAGGDGGRAAIAAAWLVLELAYSQPELPSRPPLPDEEVAQAVTDTLYTAAQALVLSRREPAQAATSFLQASEQAQAHGLLRLAVVCTMNAGAALQGLGEYDNAAACYGMAAAVGRRTAWPALLGASQTRLGAFLREIGQLERSRQQLCEALVSMAPVPSGINKANACGELAQTLLALGRGVEALAPLADAIQMYRGFNSTDNLALNLILQARVLSAADQVDAALRALADAQALIDQHSLSALNVGVLDAMAEMHRRHRLPPPAGMSAPSGALHFTLATLEAGQRIAGWKAPAALFVSLAEEWAAAGDFAQAYRAASLALELKDEALLRQMARSAAHLQLEGEEDHGGGGGAEPILDEAGLWRPQLTGHARPSTAAPAVAGALSPKEQEVLQLLARGYSNKEIAIALAVSGETVKSHLKRLFGKLEVGSRKHAVSRARTLGLPGLSS
ncbi:LuxR C-terminal-related transcriptional regulator [Paucibacter sp. AS339]|uniref:helix-turn-helix transcriptional regulator n=1 Tax=Paucibacter hankyongi TaxID=3133434 RepID=UPI0030A86971